MKKLPKWIMHGLDEMAAFAHEYISEGKKQLVPFPDSWQRVIDLIKSPRGYSVL